MQITKYLLVAAHASIFCSALVSVPAHNGKTITSHAPRGDSVLDT